MNDKEFDNLIKDALNSEDVPKSLNDALLKKAHNKRHKAKIYTFVKFGSAVAAMFICAIAVLSFFNANPEIHTKPGMSLSDSPAPKVSTIEKEPLKKPNEPTEDRAVSHEISAETNTAEKNSTAKKSYSAIPENRKTATVPTPSPKVESPGESTKDTPTEQTVRLEPHSPLPAAEKAIRAQESYHNIEISVDPPKAMTDSQIERYSGTDMEEEAIDSSPAAVETTDEGISEVTEENTSEDSEKAMDSLTALQIAKDACTVQYDSTNVSHDSETDLWKVDFYTKDTVGGDQSVYVDNSGIIQKVEYGE